MKISENYKKVLQQIHESTPFGKRSKLPRHLEKFIERIKPDSILDFGCGKGRLVEALRERFPNIRIEGYDPGNKEFDRSIENEWYDLIVSTDVLEHVEPEYIEDTLSKLRLKSKFIYHLIACSPAKLVLPDGRNAHLIIEDQTWWRQKFLDQNYKIIKEDWQEFWKTPKGKSRPMQIKKYFIMAEQS